MLLVDILHRLFSSIEKAQGSQRYYVLLVYFSILIDNLLLTSVGKQSSQTVFCQITTKTIKSQWYQTFWSKWIKMFAMCFIKAIQVNI